MRIFFKGVCLCLSLAYGFCFNACYAEQSAPKRAATETSVSLAPDFALPGLDGKTCNLGSYRGKKPVFLLFWTTWCPYCRKALATLNEMSPALTKDGIEILAVDVGEPKAKVESMPQARQVPFKILLDENSEVARTYSLLGVPTYILIDKTGAIVYKGNSVPKEGMKQLLGK